ncbi:MAG: PTS transporter subunit EIIC [Elusimicrobiaceae bacterium]|nr:PTS transporter subunit EIIC [Elusimicrobiaceae bacterium]
MPADLQEMYYEILAAVGGAENIASMGNCMTRVRFTVHDEALVYPEKLRRVPNVAGYFFSGSQHQIIVGPATASKLAAYFTSRHQFAPLTVSEALPPLKMGIGTAQENRHAIRQKYSGPISHVCARIGNIFLPLIPAYIGCGLILGITNILSHTLLVHSPTITNLLAIFGGGIFFYLQAIVGYNASKEWGGTPALGVAFAGMLNMPALANITLFGHAFVPGKGGVIAVLLVYWAGSIVEKKLRRIITGPQELFVVPVLTLLLVGAAAILLIQPVAGYLSDALAWFTSLALSKAGALAGAILGGTFLPLVMLGIHQSLIPIHQQLMDTFGFNPLFPILCMAGAGQVGASIAVLLKTRNPQLKRIIKNALPVGLMGIGEPLIYGVTLPLFKPFIAACIGGAAGGAVIALLHVTSAIAFGVSGLVLCLTLSNWVSLLGYLAGFATAVSVGFLVALKLGFDDPIESKDR